MRGSLIRGLPTLGLLLLLQVPTLGAQAVPVAVQERLRAAARAEAGEEWEVALERYAEILSQDPLSRLALEGFARAAVVVGRPQMALDASEAAIVARPEAVYPRVIRFRLLMETVGVDAVLPGWQELRGTVGTLPEVLEAGVAAARLLREEGRGEEALELLAGIPGWEARLEEVKTHLALGRHGDAVEILRATIPQLPPDESTEALALLRILGSASPAGRTLLTALVLDPGGGGLAAVSNGWSTLGEEEAPGLLLLAGRKAWAGGEVELGREFLSILLLQFPRAPEAPEAALGWSQGTPSSLRQRDEWVALLEGVLVRHPSAGVAPRLRREVDRLRGMGS